MLTASLVEDLTDLVACHQRLLLGYKELATRLLDYMLAEKPKRACWRRKAVAAERRAEQEPSRREGTGQATKDAESCQRPPETCQGCGRYSPHY